MGATAGIDLSLRSPGLVIRHGDVWSCFFIPQRKREDQIRAVIRDENAGEMTFVPLSIPVQHESSQEIHQMTRVVEAIMSALITYPVTISHVFIEGHAYGTRSASTSKLYELAGILKYRLSQSDYKYTVIPPTRLKLLFAGHGRATKQEMYQRFIQIWKGDVCKDVFGMDTNSTKTIPNPVQDIVDAYALVHSNTQPGF